MISLGTGCTAIFPLTRETKVVGTLSADVVVAEVVVKDLGVGIRLCAVDPETNQGRLMRGW